MKRKQRNKKSPTSTIRDMGTSQNLSRGGYQRGEEERASPSTIKSANVVQDTKQAFIVHCDFEPSLPACLLLTQM